MTKQPHRLEDHVSDTELDGATTGSLDIRSASLRGHVHRYEGEVRQDACAFGLHGGVLTLAVADGVGNAISSHVGANVAVREATRAVLDDQTVITRSRQAVHDSSVIRGIAPQDVSTTLVVARVEVQPQSLDGALFWPVTIWQLGDSCAVRLRAGQWAVLRHPSIGAPGDAELTNSAVDALPRSGAALTWVERFEPDDVLLLVTDGISNLATANSEYREALVSLFDGRTPSMVELARVVDATVKSFDDDRTVVSVRFLPSEG